MNSWSSGIVAALARDEIIDITTTGRRSGEPRRVEIWFRRVGGRFYITGTPGTRDWYANLLARPRFTFHLTKSVIADLAASARPVTDAHERRAVLSDPAMAWYRQKAGGLEPLIQGSPLVEIVFDD